ncbi:MAG: MBL fold metallo-hydrolase [Microthrixaceae bacterium]
MEGAGPLEVTFYGVRGSTPCACDANAGIGGNTACVVVTGDGFAPFTFDLGTGLRFWADAMGSSAVAEPFIATALVSHLHWDHVQGLPFFFPLHEFGASLHIVGPHQDDGRSLRESFDSFMTPPYFPVGLDQLAADFTFQEVTDDLLHFGTATVRAMPIPHVGATVGYRVEHDGRSVVYVSDHQQPGCGATDVAAAVLDLCRDADLLIHDAQYTEEEFAKRYTWGHCTPAYAVEVAVQSGAKRLALFHHDPAHDDEQVLRLADEAAKLVAGRGDVEVFAARGPHRLSGLRPPNPGDAPTGSVGTRDNVGTRGGSAGK